MAHQAVTFDLYSKITLTVIALSLAAIAIENVVHPVMAQLDDIKKVQICNDLGECAALQAVREPIPGNRGNFTMALQVVPAGK
jgi:hypothetical protein